MSNQPLPFEEFCRIYAESPQMYNYQKRLMEALLQGRRFHLARARPIGARMAMMRAFAWHEEYCFAKGFIT